MQKLFSLAILLSTANLALAQTFGGITPNTKFFTEQNKQAKIIFPYTHQQQSKYVLSLFNLLDSATKQTLGNKAKQWNVVMQHKTVIPNAYVRMAPIRSEFYLTPDFDNLQSGTLPWVQLLATHEYRHIQQFSNFNNGITKLASFLFGQNGQLLLNGIAVPDYFFEGDAVFQETYTTNQGRGMLPSFFAEQKALAESGVKLNWMQLRNGSYKNQIPSHYPLGYQLVAYGYEKYGKDFWKKVINDATKFKGLFYAYSQAIKRHSGISYRKFRTEALQFFVKDLPANSQQLAYQNLVFKKPKKLTYFNFPQATEQGHIVYSKSAANQLPAFYELKNGVEHLIKYKSIALDNYFHYNNGKIVYTVYDKNPRFGFENFSNITVLNIETKTEKQITKKGKYFQPALNENNTKIVAIHTDETGKNELQILDADGNLLTTINSENKIFTYPHFYKKNNIIAIARNENGTNQFVNINVSTKKVAALTPESYKAIGYPSIKGDSIWFVLAHHNSEVISVLNLSNNETKTVTHNYNSYYYPSAIGNRLYYAKVTSKGQLLSSENMDSLQATPVTNADWNTPGTNYLNIALNNQSRLILPNTITHNDAESKKYKKGFHLFNIHSWMPTINTTGSGITFESENILNTLTTSISYLKYRDEPATQIAINGRFGGLFPFINFGIQRTFNRVIKDFGGVINYNTLNTYIGANIPLSFYSGRFTQSVNGSATYNSEQVKFQPHSPNIFRDGSFTYGSYTVSFVNQLQTAVQHINPRWAQAISVNFRDAYSKTNNKKLVANSRFFFPGFSKNHSLVIGASYQRRDTLTDFFNRNFLFARGYNSFNTRRMARLSFDYYFPIAYPDFGFGNILFIQRIRANVFYDYNNSRLRTGGILQNIKYRSVGTEIYLDGKIWNSFPLNIGMRYSYKLNTDFQNPYSKSRFEIILPLNIIPE